MNSESIVRLASAFARARRLTQSTVSTYATGSGDQVGRLARGCDITTRRAARITQWFSDHWPEDLAWPVDIPRPAPSPDSPAARPPEPVADPLAVVEKELALVHEAMDAQDWAAYARHEAAMFRAARTLGDNHRIKSVKALCVALGVRRSVVDDVVKRFRDGRDGGTPRRGTDSDKVLDQLVASGDERFSERRLPEAS